MLCINSSAPTRGRENRGKGRETYKLNTRSFTNNTNNTNNINNKRNNAKYTKLILKFSELGARSLASCQQLPGSTRQFRTGLNSRQELGSGMRELKSGSGFAGRTMSRVVFRSQPWTKRARPS